MGDFPVPPFRKKGLLVFQKLYNLFMLLLSLLLLSCRRLSFPKQVGEKGISNKYIKINGVLFFLFFTLSPSSV